MVRAVLLGLLAASIASGCTTADERAPVVQGAAVGAVVELTGKVTATRGGATREIKVGSEVSGDDVIETAADGTVAIELAHNNARWSLGAGKKARVSESVAWGLPKVERLARAVEVDTTAAGRHAEHTSAETAASAIQVPVTAPKQDPVATKSEDVAPKVAKPVPKLKVGKSGSAPPGGGATGGTGSPEGGNGLGIRGTGLGGAGGGVGGGIGGNLGTIGKGGGGGGGVGQGYGTGAGKLGGKASTAPSVKVGGATVTGQFDKEIVARIVKRQLAQIRFCYEKQLLVNPTLEGTLVVKFVIGKDGKVISAVASGIDPTIETCVAARFKTFSFPAPENGIVQVNYPIVLKPTAD